MYSTSHFHEGFSFLYVIIKPCNTGLDNQLQGFFGNSKTAS